jgi:hypothetical protein
MDDNTTVEPYNGYKLHDDDLVLYGCRLICTCSACPEQYEVFDDKTGEQIAYLRLRHGYFRADVPECGGETVYESEPEGDGVFEDDERQRELSAAVAAVLRHRAEA